MRIKTVALIAAALTVGCYETATVLEEQSLSSGCDSSSCAIGCCLPDGTCAPGSDDSACGAQGESCVACAWGESCASGACVVESVGADAGVLPFDAGVVPPPVDAGTGAGDAGQPFDGGIDAGVDAGAQTGSDAGVIVCGDAGVRCDATTCAGCCVGDRCEVGTYQDQCGANGGACAPCGASKSCWAGTCVQPSTAQGADLIIDHVLVTDLHLSSAGHLSFTITVSVANIGTTDVNALHWGVAYSHDHNLSFLNDVMVDEFPISLPAGARRTVTGRATYTGPILGSPGYLFSIVDSQWVVPELIESNNVAFGGPIQTTQPSCAPGTCSGCCTTEGCVVFAEQGDWVCGSAGAACASCSPAGQVCVQGSCQ